MKLFLSLCLCVIAIGAYAQSFTVSADRMNVAYIGIENPLTIVADNASCAELMVTVENGTIQKKDSCHFYFEPTREGKSLITIQKKVNGKNVTIGMQEIRAKRIPDPVVTVGGKREGLFAVSLFKMQQGLIVDMPNFEMDMHFRVLSFMILVVRNNQVIYNEAVTGNSFTDRTRAGFGQLKAGDIVRLTDIKSVGPDKITRSMGTLSYTMR